jgi:hypothetical protein
MQKYWDALKEKTAILPGMDILSLGQLGIW